RDLRRIVTQLAQHRIRIRSKLRRHAVELAAAMRELKAAAGKSQAAVGRIQLLDGAARLICGWSIISSIVQMLAQGAPASSKIVSHSRGLFFASASSMIARSAGSFSLRANQSAKRGSLSVSSRPIADISARYCFSLLTASRM